MTLTLRQSRPFGSVVTSNRFARQTIKVLLVVDDCDPFGSAEAKSTYQLCRALSRLDCLDVTLATHAGNRDSIAKRPMDAGRGRLISPEFVDSPRVRTRSRHLGTVFQASETGLNKNEQYDANASLLAFERAVQKRFKNELRRGDFDVIHCVTSLASAVTSSFPLSSETPTLFGPVNNGQIKQSLRQDDTAPLGRLRQWMPAFRGNREPSLAGVVAGSREALEQLPEDGTRRFYLPDAESEPERFPMIRSWRAPSPIFMDHGCAPGAFRFVTAGPLVPEMSIDWIIRAMGSSSLLQHAHLTVIGEGPELGNLRALTSELGLGLNVDFLGWPDQFGIQECLRKSQAFVFPSASESDGGLIVEAMNAGLPVIVRDQGEPREIVDHSHGIRLPHDHTEGLIRSVRQTMERLATDYRLCERLGRAGSKRAREQFSWSSKAAMIVRFYESLIESNDSSECF